MSAHSQIAGEVVVVEPVGEVAVQEEASTCNTSLASWTEL